ncbi:MAG: hypothetical protein HY960_02120 [Ignavibacteriae bacterium]|nr:hypothetical protein [Ignavibacteriota bacterium]
MRQVAQGFASKEKQEIYSLLSYLVKEKQAICPLSYHTFRELFKQTDRESRLLTAEIMDNFSQQYCYISPTQIVGQELVIFIQNEQARIKQKSLHENIYFVWTKVPFILGELFPTWDNESEFSVQIRNKFLEYYSDISLKDIVEKLSIGLPHKSSSELIEKVNKGKDENQSWSTYHEVFMHEIAGILDVLQNDFEKMLMYYFEVNTGETISMEILRKLKGGKMIADLIYKAFDKRKIRKELPFINIKATIHAQYRYDKSRRFKENDIEDIGHTAWALPYCQYYFTEDNYATLIKQTKIDLYYSTTVLSKEKDIIHELSKLI